MSLAHVDRPPVTALPDHPGSARKAFRILRTTVGWLAGTALLALLLGLLVISASGFGIGLLALMLFLPAVGPLLFLLAGLLLGTPEGRPGDNDVPIHVAPVGEGMLITRVPEGSGFHAGDLIVMAYHHPVAHRETWDRLLPPDGDHGYVHLRVEHQGGRVRDHYVNLAG